MANQYTALPWPERFWAKVDKTDFCWLWLASKDSCGYGVIRSPLHQKNKRAHILSFLMANNLQNLENNLCVCHKCDNPSCVNPEHLFVGSQRENVIDMVKKGRHGHGSNTISYDDWLATRPNKSKFDMCQKKLHVLSDQNVRIKFVKTGYRRLCKICEFETSHGDPLMYKVKNFVRNVDNRRQIVQDLYLKIVSLGEKCFYCDGPFECFDHIVPKSLGGVIDANNINPSCFNCNLKKGKRI